MRGTPQWDVCVDWGDSGMITDANDTPILGVRRAHLQSGLCEVLKLDSKGYRLPKPDNSGPQTVYKKYAAPLSWKSRCQT